MENALIAKDSDMSVKPITPREVVGKKQESLPDEVIEAFNELIAENWEGSSSRIKQIKAVAKIREKFLPKRITAKKMFDNNWLDVEDVFRKAGWDVEYDKPGFNETYEPIFEFSKKRK